MHDNVWIQDLFRLNVISHVFRTQEGIRASVNSLSGQSLMSDHVELRRQIVEVIPRMRRFARGLCGNASDADDLVQVALEKALTRLHQFQPGTRLDSWLFRIVQTSFLDDRRKAARREEGMDMTTLESLPQMSSPDPNPSRSELADVYRALDTLPDEQRQLILLVLVEGYSYQEAADLMATPIGTVMSRLSRARKALMAALKEPANV